MPCKANQGPKAWALPRFWVSIHSYKKQLVKKIWGRILGLAWLKFAVARAPVNPLKICIHSFLGYERIMQWNTQLLFRGATANLSQARPNILPQFFLTGCFL